MKKLALHWKIIIGLVLGVIFGIFSSLNGWSDFTNSYIAPVGIIFINLLKLISVPLVLSSIVTGVASLSSTKKLSRIGGKAIGIYVGTTTLAVTMGLFSVNIIQPGNRVSSEMSEKLQKDYNSDLEKKFISAESVKNRGPLQPIIDIFPENFFTAASSNRNMLQVVFIALFLGIGLIQIPKKEAKPILDFFKGLNQVVIKLVDLIMVMAPYGVFALIASTMSTIAGNNPSEIISLLSGIGFYMITVIIGLTAHVIITYTSILKLMTTMPLNLFYKGIAPAQLLAFSTSSSGATLPATMECCEEKLGVSEEVSSFILPLGATINMDGTALYQAVAAVFIAQAIGMDLTFTAQLTIILTAVLASIGTAAVPSAGIIMLVIILETVGVPTKGIALILGVDRILDMIRTVVNVTGDASVSVIIASSEDQLSIPVD
tara:strand:+ start:17033 stop:18325 length:1293 start_codon:yes stop_codon:yes gene_type:complete